MIDDLDAWKNDTNTTENSNFLIQLQAQFGCCGVEGPTDWLNAANWKAESKNGSEWANLPKSCCKNDSKNQCVLQKPGNSTKNGALKIVIVERLTNGCYDELLNGTYLLGTVSLTIFFFQLAVLFFALYFYRRIKSDSSIMIF